MASEQTERGQVTQFYICNYAPLMASEFVKVMDLPIGATVTMTGVNKTMTVRGVTATYCQVEYVDGRGPHVGYVYCDYVEPLQYTLMQDVVKIGNKTANPQDAEQYILYNGTTQYNLCGPLAIAYVTGWRSEITWLLDKYKANNPTWWQKIFRGGAGRGTDLGDLDAMLAEFDGYTLPATRLSAALYDKVKGGPLVTPFRVKSLLRDNFVIASCRIDSVTGRLRGQGVLHWVVLVDVWREKTGGIVHLYNPFTNSIEAYSWQEWVASSGQPYGIVVPRFA